MTSGFSWMKAMIACQPRRDRLASRMHCRRSRSSSCRASATSKAARPSAIYAAAICTSNDLDLSSELVSELHY